MMIVTLYNNLCYHVIRCDSVMPTAHHNQRDGSQLRGNFNGLKADVIRYNQISAIALANKLHRFVCGCWLAVPCQAKLGQARTDCPSGNSDPSMVSASLRGSSRALGAHVL